MNKSPAFQWYPKDILASARVQEMSLAEEGAYRRLLDFCWLNGSIPSDESRVARLIGKGATVQIARVCLKMFEPDPTDEDRMIHERLEAERVKQQENSIAKQKAANERWSKRGTPAEARGKQVNTDRDSNAMHTQYTCNAPALHTECSASSSSSASAEEVNNTHTQQLRARTREPSPDGGVGVGESGNQTGNPNGHAPPGSYFSLEQRKAYAAAQGLGGGWIHKSQSGEYDETIELYLSANRQAAATRSPVECVECGGSGRKTYFDLASDSDVEKPCFSCKGSGKV